MSLQRTLPKTLLVGLDAACWEYLEPLLLAGHLPNLEELLSRGSFGTLRSVMPPVTPAAWSSIVTGVNPGKHGVFEWVRRRADDYHVMPESAATRVGTTIWQRLNAAGIRTGIMNIPLTYPVQPVEGFLLCGFSAPAGKRDVAYPQGILEDIEQKYGPYKTDVSISSDTYGSSASYYAERDFQERQVRIASHLARQHQVHVLIINLMLIDHANHTMVDSKLVTQAMINTDEHLGILLSEFQPDNTMVISDHGSRRVRGIFMLQAWLAENGYLTRGFREHEDRAQVLNYLLAQWRNGGESVEARIRRRMWREGMLRLPRSVTTSTWRKIERDIPLSTMQFETTDSFIPETTKVYLLGSNRGNLTVNLQGREPKGIVSTEEYKMLVEKLMMKLSEIIDPETNEALFQNIYRPDDVYTGPFKNQAPDLIGDYYGSRWTIISNLPGLNRRPWRYFLTGERWYGDHSRDGIFVMCGRDFKRQTERNHASLLDIPATLLYLYDVPQPEDYDGVPMRALLSDDFVDQHPLRYQPGDERFISSSLDTQWDEQMLQRLQALGYLDA